MPKTIEGYYLDKTTAVGVAGVPVTLYNANTAAVLSGITGLSTNPTTTDANGHFKFTMDLDPGPVYVDANNAGTHDRRYSLETMRTGDHWMSDIGEILRPVSDGVIAGQLNQFAVTCSGVANQFTVATGKAVIQSYIWSLESGSVTKTISANATMATRLSIVVLRQYTGGPSQGKQEIDILYGTSNNVAPSVRQGVNVSGDIIWELPLARLSTTLNASVSTVAADLRVYAGLGMTVYDGLVPIVGTAHGIDFSGNSFIITDEGNGIALITPSFGSGAADFKRGNAGTNGTLFGYAADGSGSAAIAGKTNYGNSGEFEVVNVTTTLDPTVTYDVTVTGNLGVVSSAVSAATNFRGRVSLDAPFNSSASIGSYWLASGTSTSFHTGGNVTHEWVYRGVTGVSSIKAYLYIRPYVGGADVWSYVLSAKFSARG